jgi:mannose/fructose/N-acetylgalactosamine-specific phosphotransferase system component IID
MSVPLDAPVRRAMLLRSLLVQGSFNYRTLIGTGMAYVLAPALRKIHGPEGADAAGMRHAELFNSHPYLTGLAAGAVARAESDGVPAETIVRFKSALRGSLGTVGDRLVWLVWRPAAALLAVALLLSGVPWWLSIGAFLVTHNALHLWLRVWGLRVGLREGIGVARALREAPLQQLGERASTVGAVLAGFAAVRMVGSTANDPLEYAIGALAIGAGVLLSARTRPAATIGLAVALVAAVILARNT